MSDFYYDNGFCVFTREYLISRGYCCACGCRHCPYIEKDGDICHNDSGHSHQKCASDLKDEHEEQNDPEPISPDIFNNPD